MQKCFTKANWTQRKLDRIELKKREKATKTSSDTKNQNEWKTGNGTKKFRQLKSKKKEGEKNRHKKHMRYPAISILLSCWFRIICSLLLSLYFICFSSRIFSVHYKSKYFCSFANHNNSKKNTKHRHRQLNMLKPTLQNVLKIRRTTYEIENVRKWREN